ncbi:MAG: hypothetical protein Q8M84_02960 [Thiobacillus sp.]|nr:hypothetical protein [Thiobacillus sp.]
MNSFGIRNELKAHTQHEQAKKAARMNAVVAVIFVLVVTAYAAATCIDQSGAFK